MAVITRRAVVVVAAAVAPLTVLVAIFAPHRPTVLLACFWSASVVAVAGFLGWKLSRRLKELAAFADQMLDVKGPSPKLQFSDDDLGDLARSLARTAPKAAELGRALDLELARRRAVLAG